LAENRRFEPTQPLFNAPVGPLGVTPLEFSRDLRSQKPRVPWLSQGVVCVILLLAVLVEHRLVTDRRTDRHTMTASTALA